MTLLPADDWKVAGAPGPRYKVGPKCSHPRCGRYADHAHHLFRRSFLTGDYAWVEIDGTRVGNLAGLCWNHHEQVTGRVGGHQAWIRWDGQYEWWDRKRHWPTEDEWERVGPLDPHPPTGDEQPAQEESEDEEPPCPTCGKRARKTPPLPSRRRKNWIVQVPDDTEDGAAVLDVLVEEAARALHRHDHAQRRYYVLVESLAFLLQNSSHIA